MNRKSFMTSLLGLVAAPLALVAGKEKKGGFTPRTKCSKVKEAQFGVDMAKEGSEMTGYCFVQPGKSKPLTADQISSVWEDQSGNDNHLYGETRWYFWTEKGWERLPVSNQAARTGRWDGTTMTITAAPSCTLNEEDVQRQLNTASKQMWYLENHHPLGKKHGLRHKEAVLDYRVGKPDGFWSNPLGESFTPEKKHE